MARRPRREVLDMRRHEFVWGRASSRRRVSLSDDEDALMARLSAWTQLKEQRGYHDCRCYGEVRGSRLSQEFAKPSPSWKPVYVQRRARKRTCGPTPHDPTSGFGDDVQRLLFVERSFGRECVAAVSPNRCGSDMRAWRAGVRDGDDGWQRPKGWSSGARFAAWGELIAVRT